MRHVFPKVSLVGAGPGDPDLITLKGLKAIQSANVILYDALVNEALLEHAPAECMKVYVGKRAGQHYRTQQQINAMIVQYALSFGHVVRLKGGDPFVFGRGHEELTYIEQFNIPCAVVPGLSSSTSIATLQHVPITRRHVSESFWVITATTKEEKLSKDLELAQQSSATLVILMGIRKLAQIVQNFLDKGECDKPFMIVQNGSFEEEKVVLATAENIVETAARENIGTPGIIIIGETVKLHPKWKAIEATVTSEIL
ncbi:MAG: uroporphyrinogen-III C-methyltransferase [Bacteroidota bacterium]